MENRAFTFDREKARKPHIYIKWGENGHESEYLVTIHSERFASANDIPGGWERSLVSYLGNGWSVANRGARIEIRPPQLRRTSETDEKIVLAIHALVGSDNQFEISKING